jgi:nicotinate-nucleotide adenylyltransferase
VVLMPAHTSPFKPSAPDPGPEHRMHMCGALVASQPGVSVCSLEVARGGVSYTADTLSAIHASHPDAELTFIVGADTVRTLPRWRAPGRVVELARLAVAQRSGTERGQVLDSLRSLNGAQRVSFLAMPVIDVSSSEVRLRAARGEPIADLVGAGVARYIEEQRLYSKPDGAAA